MLRLGRRDRYIREKWHSRSQRRVKPPPPSRYTIRTHRENARAKCVFTARGTFIAIFAGVGRRAQTLATAAAAARRRKVSHSHSLFSFYFQIDDKDTLFREVRLHESARVRKVTRTDDDVAPLTTLPRALPISQIARAREILVSVVILARRNARSATVFLDSRTSKFAPVRRRYT